jgi:hypothetical protein
MDLANIEKTLQLYITEYEKAKGSSLTKEEKESLRKGLIEEMDEERGVQMNIESVRVRAPQLEALHKTLLANPSRESLDIWVAGIAALYPSSLYDESEVTRVKDELGDIPDKVHLLGWTANTFERMEASGNSNDCMIHSFLTCVSPTFRRTLRKTASTLQIREQRVGDIIAGLFRRTILPQLVHADIIKMRAITNRNRQNLSNKEARIVADLVGEGPLSDEVFGILSRSFRIVIFLRDRPEDARAAAGFAHGLEHNAGQNGWAGMDLNVPSNEFIIIFNPGRGHYEPVRDGRTNHYIFDYLMIAPRYPRREDIKRIQYKLEHARLEENDIRVLSELKEQIEQAVIAATAPSSSPKKTLLEKRLINSESELDNIKTRLEKLQLLLNDNSSVKIVVRRNIRRLEDEKRILEQIIQQMKTNLKGGTRKKRSKKRSTLKR